MPSINLSTKVSAKNGVKGSDVYQSTGDPRVDLSTMAVRGCSGDTLKRMMGEILELGKTDPQAYEDAFLLFFQTRNIRGGKGEREVSYAMMALLLGQTPFMIQMLDLVPKYGCWRDLFHLAASMLESTNDRCTEIKEAVLKITRDQLKKDAFAADEPISLCAKWAPREGKGTVHNQTIAKELAASLFPQMSKVSQRLAAYRKMLSKLNKRIDTVEVKMCAGDWEEIKPPTVPGRALDKYRAAFLNETLHKVPHGSVYRPRFEPDLRHHEDEARMACREHFKEHFAAAARGEVTLKGADTVYPHEVIKKIRDSWRYDQYYGDVSLLSKGERDLIIGQWHGFVEKARAGGALRDCVALCDFSGSMDGIPKMVSMALGLLIAEVSGTNKFLTFDSEPTWHQMRADDTIIKRVESIGNIGHGLSTDFQKAMDLVLADVKARRLRPEQIPKDLIVFTDMGFDQACGSDKTSFFTGHSYRNVVKTAPWQTHIQMIREAWKRAGEDMWNQAFVPPRIVIWNLRAEYKDFHATVDQEGVIMLSGWSPALFKVIQETRVEVITPMGALRLQLDDPMYDPVRLRLRALMSGE